MTVTLLVLLLLSQAEAPENPPALAAHLAFRKGVGEVPDSTPPPGWRPLGPDDELLLTLLPDEEV
ncbi:hypothetical protein [Archangium violaceum]|uniref:hypothetical protein n=1 Tax=Archangium violaceum TaxID=83451 RepID=UPI0036D8C7A1